MRNSLKIYLDTFYRPSRSFPALLGGHYFRSGFLYMMIPLALYTLMYVFLTIGGGAPSTFTPWLNISKEHYYFWNQFLLAPSMILAWFCSAAFIQSASHAFHGTGSFEQTLALTGLSISVSMWSTLLHDLLMSFFSAIHVIDAKQHEIAMNTPTIWRAILWCCFALYFFAFTALFYKTVRIGQGLGKIISFIIGFLGFIIFQVVFLIFNR